MIMSDRFVCLKSGSANVMLFASSARSRYDKNVIVEERIMMST